MYVVGIGEQQRLVLGVLDHFLLYFLRLDLFTESGLSDLARLTSDLGWATFSAPTVLGF